MIPISAVKDAAAILGIALPVLVEALRAIQQAVEGDDVVMLPADAPDLMKAAQENRADLARRATSTDRASIDAALAAPGLAKARATALPPTAIMCANDGKNRPVCGRPWAIVAGPTTASAVTCPDCIAGEVYGG